MPQKIIFTSCTANYLAQAKSLGDSIVRTNPDYQLVIGLVDKIDNRFDVDTFYPHIILEVEKLVVPDFEDMQRRYTLLELSCALKPFFALYLFKHYQSPHIIYFDTDILLFGSLAEVEEELTEQSVLLTPHLLSPLPEDGKRPFMTGVIKTGIYNAGFFAVRYDVTGMNFLNWWKEILVKYCYENSKRGLASDQGWLNFVPVFFENVRIINHPGYNVAYWNLHERQLEKKDGKYYVNKRHSLLFFHFSGYSTQHPELISRHQDRFTMNDNPVVKELFHFYHESLMRNNHGEITKLPCFYKRKKSFWQKLGFRK